MLVLLDNCEHVLNEVAPLVVRLLGDAPQMRLLCTSRQPLGVAGEQLWIVEGLTEAAELFIDRALSIDPGFEPDDAEVRVVETVCAELDGMPLAIELAAARPPIAPGVQDISARLSSRFTLLRSSLRERRRTSPDAAQRGAMVLRPAH